MTDRPASATATGAVDGGTVVGGVVVLVAEGASLEEGGSLEEGAAVTGGGSLVEGGAAEDGAVDVVSVVDVGSASGATVPDPNVGSVASADTSADDSSVSGAASPSTRPSSDVEQAKESSDNDRARADSLRFGTGCNSSRPRLQPDRRYSTAVSVRGHPRTEMPLSRTTAPLRWSPMDWFANNWPILLVALAVFIIFTGLIRKVAKIAFFGVAVGALGLFIWPFVSSSI